ncbi:MAG: diguanylate cyclase [Gammaproteobacteria bacterium]
MSLARLLWLLPLLLAAGWLPAAEPLTVAEGFLRAPAAGHSEFLRTTDARELAQVIAADGWQPRKSPLHLTYSTDSFWQRFALRRGDNGPARLRLDIGSPLADQLDIHVVDRGVVTATYLLGDTRPATNRPYSARHFVVPIVLPVDRDLVVYLRVQSHGAMKVPVTLWSEPAFIAREQRELLGLLAVYGAVVSALLLFVFVARGTREPGFHGAVLFIFAVTLFQAHIDGIFGQYFPVGGSWWNQYNTAVTGLLATVIGTWFAAHMLGLPERAPATRHLLRAGYLVYGLLFPLALLVFGARALPALAIGVLAYAAGSVLLGAYAMDRRLPRAGIYTALMSVFLVGAALSGLDRFDVLAFGIRLHDALLACVFIQLLVLGYVLVQRIRQERRARLEAEQQSLGARKRALAAEWHMAYELEREVERQTEALSQTMRELRDANRQLADMSMHDGLTGLHNRRHFDERFPALVQLAARRQEPLAVMMLDVDHFKQVNDTHGHLVGDDCLRQVATTLRQVMVRSTDLLARYGGEEFVVVLPGTGEAEAAVIAERIRLAVEATPIPNGETPLHVTLSIGLAVRVPDAGDASQLLADADAALYRAKNNGRNRVVR